MDSKKSKNTQSGKQTNRTAYPKKRSKKKKRSSRFLLYLSLIFGAAVTLAVLSLTVFFHIDTIKVEGKSRYTTNQIIEASEINKGENLFLAKTDRADPGIRTSLPYIDLVKISKRFPATVVITVNESPAYAQIEKDGKYIIINRDGKALETNPKLQVGIPVIRDVSTEAETPGKEVKFTDTDKKEALKAIFASFEEKKIAPITVITMASPVDVKVTYNNKIVLELGSTANLDKKLAYAVTVIEERKSSSQTGILNLSCIPNDKAQVYFADSELSDKQKANVLRK